MHLQLPDIDFEKYLDQNEMHRQKVQSPKDFFDGAYDRVINGLSVQGDALPWSKTHEHFRFRGGEITIWAGVNGNGKSLVMGQAAVWLDSPVVIASMEMLPEATLARMLRQCSGVSSPSRDFSEAIVDKLHGKLWIYNQVGNVEQKALFGMIQYVATELEVKHVMIDSLVKCGLGTDDYNAQKHFVDRLTTLAKDLNIHIHLVVHMRKQSSEQHMPDKNSIKGAGEITDLADNVIIISRKIVENGEDAPSDEEPTGFIRIAKQRHGEFEGTFAFWFHAPSQQWIPTRRSQPMPWMTWSRK